MRRIIFLIFCISFRLKRFGGSQDSKHRLPAASRVWSIILQAVQGWGSEVVFGHGCSKELRRPSKRAGIVDLTGKSVWIITTMSRPETYVIIHLARLHVSHVLNPEMAQEMSGDEHIRAIVQDGPGGPEVLKVGDHAKPYAGPGRVLIKSYATALNGADLLQRSGKYSPPEGQSAQWYNRWQWNVDNLKGWIWSDLHGNLCSIPTSQV